MKSEIQLSEEVQDVLEENDWSANYYEAPNGDCVVELEGYSPAGVNFTLGIIYDGTETDFVTAVRREAMRFDPDGHAARLIPDRGMYGIPEHILDIINDAMAIQDMIFELADALERRLKEVNG